MYRKKYRATKKNIMRSFFIIFGQLFSICLRVCSYTLSFGSWRTCSHGRIVTYEFLEIMRGWAFSKMSSRDNNKTGVWPPPSLKNSSHLLFWIKRQSVLIIMPESVRKYLPSQRHLKVDRFWKRTPIFFLNSDEKNIIESRRLDSSFFLCVHFKKYFQFSSWQIWRAISTCKKKVRNRIDKKIVVRDFCYQ